MARLSSAPRCGIWRPRRLLPRAFAPAFTSGTRLLVERFGIGLSAGVASISGQNNVGTNTTASGATLGTLLEYQWIMGKQQNVALALGAGAKVIMAKATDITDATTRYPTARISVGYAW